MSEEDRNKSLAVTREREAKERERRLAELGLVYLFSFFLLKV